MFKKRKEEKKMKKYIGKIYFDNGNMAMEIESTKTLDELMNWAIKSLKSETFTLITDGENKVNIFNSKNIKPFKIEAQEYKGYNDLPLKALEVVSIQCEPFKVSFIQERVGK